MQKAAGDMTPVKIRVEKKSKYMNVRTSVAGIMFDSKVEAHRYMELRMMEGSGLISYLRCQVPFVLIPAVTIHGKQIRPMKYVADFCYEQGGREIVEDVKGGKATREYLMKRHLMKHVHGIEIYEYRRAARVS